MNKLKTLALITLTAGFLVGCTSASETEAKIFTMEEVAKASTKADCKMIINDKVYDVTDYVNSHPGGNDILQGCGKDATALFSGANPDGRDHSEVAERTVERYFVGNLAK